VEGPANGSTVRRSIGSGRTIARRAAEGDMAEKVRVTVGELVEALARIEKWTKEVRQILAEMDSSTVAAEIRAAPRDGDRRIDGVCPPPRRRRSKPDKGGTRKTASGGRKKAVRKP
jgi:hypothetical protein